ncbi:hypothetical protein E2C01_086410 [Portunus trituberculatus]|uniref:Uncharacterized protein n=1 Tax=Portunus trituberculatus TaxID=210409 RepID=A0A5B7JDD8_PORTR|nr:hypothetical protein [Portunus trituberculatus]
MKVFHPTLSHSRRARHLSYRGKNNPASYESKSTHDKEQARDTFSQKRHLCVRFPDTTRLCFIL